MGERLEENGSVETATTRFGSKQCHRCVQVLQHVLSQPGSRPRALLEAIAGSMSSNVIEAQESGVLIHLKSEADANIPIEHTESVSGDTTTRPSLTRRWTPPRLKSKAGPPVSVNPTSLPSPQPLAASAATETSSLSSSLKSLSIDCRPCAATGPESGARAFVMGPNPLSVVVCSNRLHFLDSNNTTAAPAEEMEQVLVHELMHVYDVQRLKLNLQQCRQLAYSEVRAAREAECHGFSWYLPQSYCVQQKARLATCNLFPQDGKACVEHVLTKAMADKRPFEDVSTEAAVKKKPVRGESNATTTEQFFVPYPSDR